MKPQTFIIEFYGPVSSDKTKFVREIEGDNPQNAYANLKKLKKVSDNQETTKNEDKKNNKNGNGNNGLKKNRH